MMMAQTSLISTVNNCAGAKPSSVLNSVNTVIRENISRLGSDHYMTMMAIHLNDSQMIVAGKHQDMIIYRAATDQTETVPTEGTWLGIADNIEKYLKDVSVEIKEGDIVLLFTDGVTEATNNDGEMYGQIRLEHAVNQYAGLPPRRLLEKIVDDVTVFQEEQLDDMTLVVLKKSADQELNWS